MMRGRGATLFSTSPQDCSSPHGSSDQMSERHAAHALSRQLGIQRTSAISRLKGDFGREQHQHGQPPEAGGGLGAQAVDGEGNEYARGDTRDARVDGQRRFKHEQNQADRERRNDDRPPQRARVASLQPDTGRKQNREVPEEMAAREMDPMACDQTPPLAAEDLRAVINERIEGSRPKPCDNGKCARDECKPGQAPKLRLV